jgi:hypothetical protein
MTMSFGRLSQKALLVSDIFGHLAPKYVEHVLPHDPGYRPFRKGLQQTLPE